MRIAKAIARAGLCSRRDAEGWIEEGRVKVNGKILTSPAHNVGPADRIDVDDAPLPRAEPVRLWRYYKPKGMVTSHRDPQGRSTVFASLPDDLPRVVSVGRLDFNTEGLLLLTNDGALARHLELPATGWLRRYRVRAHGRVSQAQLDALKTGITVEGVRYGPIEAVLDSKQGANVWLSIGIREGKNREVRRVLNTLDLEVNRLIRVSFGPFQLKEMKDGAVELVPRRVLIDQLGPKLAAELGITSTGDDAPASNAGSTSTSTGSAGSGGRRKSAGAQGSAAKSAGPGKPGASTHSQTGARSKTRRVDAKDRTKRLQLVDGPEKQRPKRKSATAVKGGKGANRSASGRSAPSKPNRKFKPRAKPTRG